MSMPYSVFVCMSLASGAHIKAIGQLAHTNIPVAYSHIVTSEFGIQHE